MDLITLLSERKAKLKEESRALLDAAAKENRTDITPEEDVKWHALQDEIKVLEGRIAEYTAAETREAAVAAATARTEAASAQTSSVTVKSPLTYRYEKRGPGKEGVRRTSEYGFLMDAFQAREGNPEAAQRIGRHQAEMRDAYANRGVEGVEARAGTTSGNYSGLTVPIYLVDEYAALARAGRPFADTIPSADLPPVGMTVNISRITTGTSTGVQATQNTAVAEVDLSDTLLTIPVVSIAGAESVSFQALDRAALSEEIIMADMALSYNTTLDQQLISGSGAAGQHLGIQTVAGISAVTYVDAAPTVPKIYSKIADAVQRVNALRFAPADLILMHPRRWGWFLASLDSSNRPLVLPNPMSNFNAMGKGNPDAYGVDVAGSIMGLRVVTDANISLLQGAGTEDAIIVTRTRDHRLWEAPDSPLFLQFERRWSPSKKNLTDVAVIYGYSAFTAGRYPQSTSTVTGTGLIAPTF